MTNNEAISILTEWVDNGTHEFIHEALQLAIKALETQPDGDVISRQAAIDAMINSRSNADVTLVPGSYTNGWRDGRKLLLDELLQVVFALPSAQPEIASDGTLNVTVDADIASIGRILLSQAGTQRGGLYYKDEEPEIIHCAECKWLQCNMRQDGTLPKGVDEFECRHWCGYCDPMDFCSHAERRTDGTEQP